jgi:putative glutamine amidotransferase
MQHNHRQFGHRQFGHRQFGRDEREQGRRAVVGVLCCNRAIDGRNVQAAATRFVDPLVHFAGVSVLLVPAVPAAVDIIGFARLLDGLLLTGSCSNVAAARYGGDRVEAHGDEDRDEVALRLAAAMIEAGRPVFGICRGLQELNVLFGGSLRPDVGATGHHSGDSDTKVAALFDHHHDIDIAAGGVLAGVMGGDRCRVNSVHHQGLDRLGGGLAIEATAPDGLVEAVSAHPCGAPVLGVQWHPEWDAATNPRSRSFFELLGAAAAPAP